MKKHLLVCVLALLMALCLLAACGESEPAATPTPEPSPEPVTELVTTVTEDDIAILESYPHLEKLDLSGSQCYAAIESYISAHPEVEVSYTISLGGSEHSFDTTELSLEPGSYDYESLLANLVFLRSLQSLNLPCIELSAEQYNELCAAYPELTIDYTVEILGNEYGIDTNTIDLSALESSQLDSAAAKIALLPAVESINLSGSALSLAQVKLIRTAAPAAAIDYAFQLFGRDVNTLDTNIVFDSVEIGDEGEAEVRAALDILAEGSRLCFDSCGFSDEVMASIRDDYPKHKLVWRIWFGEYFNMLTDEETIRAIFDVYDGSTEALKYCTEVKYIDLGHNSNLSEVDFIAYMPKLEICIMSQSPFSDMSVFANCPNLEWLELVYCPNVTDISPLEGLTNLKYLNLTYTNVTDISMLGSDIPLERFFYARHKLSAEQIAEFEEKHPDCWCTYSGFEYGQGWRYEDAGNTVFSEPYLKLREIFRYSENYYNTKNWQPKA